MASKVGVALLGAGGFGRTHLDRLARLAEEGSTELIGVCDPAGPSDKVPEGTAMYSDLAELLAETTPEVVIVSTPIHTHVPLAIQAMEAGADVYLEKPPAASLAAFSDLLAVQRRTGRVCQVGFQSLGSAGLGRIPELIADGVIGDVVRYQARGLWLRRRYYYQRSAWAGKRRDGEVIIADGVTTNPLSHSVATALRLAGLEQLGPIDSITTELYRAHDIECDDTSFIEVTPRDGTGVAPVRAALTVCAPEQRDALVDVVGTEGMITFHYTNDVIDIVGADGSMRTETAGRTDLFENLLAHRDDPGVELLSPLERTSSFTGVLQAVLDAPAPTRLSEGSGITWVDEGDDAHPVLADIPHWVDAAVADGGYAAAGAPWASSEAVTVHQI